MRLAWESLGKRHVRAIAACFAGDAEGMRRVAFYSDPRRLLRLIDEKTRFAWVVRDNGRLIGLIDLEIVREGIGALALYICPASRGKGYCRALLDGLLATDPVRHLNTLIGSVEHDNEASIRCLRANGFVATGEEGVGMIEMEKVLSRAAPSVRGDAFR